MNTFSRPLKFFTITIAIIGFLLLSLIFISEMPNLSEKSTYLEIVEIITVVIYIFIMAINIIETIKLEKQSEKIQTLEDYNKTLMKVNDSICGFKHDFSNFVQALDGYVETNNMAGVKTMSRSILKDYVCTKNLEALNPNIIKNEAIYSIISKKYFLAQSKNVNMNLEIIADLRDVQDFSYEICRILAILIDNAIEAAEKCENGFINLRILNDSKISRKVIVVENTYNNKNIDIDKLFEKGYSSKENNMQNHGLGLWNVRKILRKKDNLNLYTTKGELFSQQLEIY